jgi:hypothetical protein
LRAGGTAGVTDYALSKPLLAAALWRNFIFRLELDLSGETRDGF